MIPQKSTDEFWIDESGTKIPYKRVTELERLKERQANKLAKEALKVNQVLISLKDLVITVCNEIFEKHMAATNVAEDKRGKGNYMWFNFDRSIKIEVRISDRIDFDDLTIKSAKAKFDEFVDRNIEGKVEFAKEMVSDAFSTSKGKLDVKKLMNLLRYKTRINDPLFQEAMALLESAIRKPDSKSYQRIWVRDDQNQYKIINLDFAAL